MIGLFLYYLIVIAGGLALLLAAVMVFGEIVLALQRKIGMGAILVLLLAVGVVALAWELTLTNPAPPG